MGSKKIKAVVVKGKMKVPLHDEARMKELKKKILKQATGGYPVLNKYGTAGFTHDSVISGDGPVKNWGGAGTSDFPSEQARRISDDAVIGVEGYKPYGCWRCPVACGGRMRQKSGKFALEFNDGIGHKPEYETLALYGSNLLNDNLPSIIKVNEICNNLGLDTIAAGATIGYAIECYENGLLNQEQTDGLELTWGNAEAIVALTEKMGRREGLGDILADGVAAAWKKFGEIGTEYAAHVQGEEIPAHDPKFIPGLATTYLVTATPARHTQGGELLTPPGFDAPETDKYNYSGQADVHSKLVAIHEVINAAGLCMFGSQCYPIQTLPEQLSAVTGQDYDMENIYQVGMRIYTMRHAFNLREGLNPLTRNVPGRIIGEPPLKEGNVRDVTVDYKLLINEFLEHIGWDTATTVPADETLRKLDLEFLIEDLKKADVPAV
jgi:aldehyde:ferredoxin oxidoreductase